MSWIDDLLGYKAFRNLAGVLLPQRSRVRVAGGIEATDDPTAKETVLTVDLSDVEVDLDEVVQQTTTALTIYVDGVAGNDAFPGTVGSPVATLAAALALVPSLLRHDVLIRIVTAGTYACPSIDRFIFAGGQLFVYGVPVNEIVASTSAGASSSANVVKTSGASVNARRGKFIEILTGPGAGNRRLIRNNTATDIVPARSFSAAITTSSTYRIIEPAVVLDVQTGLQSYERVELRGPSSPHALRGGYKPGLSFANVEFSAATDTTVCIAGEVTLFGCVAGEAVEFDCELAALLSLGTDTPTPSAVAPFVAGITASLAAWTGYGFTAEAALGVGFDGPRSHWIASGYIVAAKYASSDRGGTSRLFGGSLYGSGTYESLGVAGRGSHVVVSANTPPLRVESASTIAAVIAALGGTINLSGGEFVCVGNGSAAVAATSDGVVNVRQATSVTGSGESYGARAYRGGKVYITVASTALTFSGADDDTRGAVAIGESPSRAAGTCAQLGTALANNGDYMSLADGTVIQRATL